MDFNNDTYIINYQMKMKQNIRNLPVLRMALLILLSACAFCAHSQVTVGTGTPPRDFSVLEVSTVDTKGGLRLPQLYTAERDAWRDYFLGTATDNPVITGGPGVTPEEAAAAEGLAIFNLDTKCYEYWNATRWVSLCEGNSQMTISPDPCTNVAADGTGCDDEFTVTDPDCLNGPFTIIIAAGQDYAQLTDVNEADGMFRIAFHPNNSINQRSVVVRVTSSCTGLYKDFLFLQDGYACDATLGEAPEITSVPTGKTITFCAGGAVYLSINETQITTPGTLADVIWTRNNIEVARGVNNLVVTQEGKYDVWMGYVGCNQKAGNAVTVTRDGTGAPQPVSIVVNGNNGMVCDPAGTTKLVAMNPNSGGTVLWFKDGIQTAPASSTGVPGGVEVEVGVGDWFAVVQDGTCYSRPSQTVSVREDNSGGTLDKPVIDKGGTFCAGSSVQLSVAAPQPGYTYTWYENNTQIGMGSSILYTVPGGAPSVVIRCRASLAGSCAQEELTVETITTGTIPARPVITGNTVLCSGSATLNIIPSGSGTYTYAWYKNNTLIATTQQITVTSGGDYYATVTDGCTSPRAHINIPAASSAAPSVNFESSAPVPNVANTGDIITYRATINFGPALSYTWTTGNATILDGGGISDDFAVVQYGTAGSPAFVQVVVTNACGAGTGSRNVASVGTACEEMTAGTLSPSADQTKSAIANAGFSLGAVSVQFGSAQTAYQWYRNTVKSTTAGTPESLVGMTNNTLITKEATAGTYYYYCVMTNKSCAATPVTSPFYEVTVTVIPSQEGATGNFAGKSCFDIAYSNFGGDCGTEAARLTQKTDFALTDEQDAQAGTSTAVYTGKQVYTFIPSGNVSNVRFAYLDASGEAIESMTAKADYSGNISSGTLCKAVVLYKPSLNTFLRGKTRDQAVKPELYVIYNDQSGEAGIERSLKMTVSLQDCACCGAVTTGGGWLNFMCHNLGADESLDPFSYVVGNADGSGGTLGYLYQWGRPSDGHQLRNSATTTTLATSNIPGHNNFIIVTSSPWDWKTPASTSNRWGDGTDAGGTTKGPNDPCPAGWRIPTSAQYEDIVKVASTNGVLSWNNGTKIGPALFLPAGGTRACRTATVGEIGTRAYYATSSLSPTYAMLRGQDVMSGEAGRTFVVRGIMGFPDGTTVRCIEDRQ